MKICELTDQEVDDDYTDAVASYGWEVYIPVTQKTKNDQKKEDAIEVIEFKKESQSAAKMDLYIIATNLNICFPIMPRKFTIWRVFTIGNDEEHPVFAMAFNTDIIGIDHIGLIFFDKAVKFVYLYFETNEYLLCLFQQFSTCVCWWSK